MIRCPDKHWAQAACSHLLPWSTAYATAFLFPESTILHSWLGVLQFMDHWQLFPISAHRGSHANCISGLPVQPKDLHGSHSLHSAGYIQYTEFFLTNSRLDFGNPSQETSQCSLKPYFDFFYFTIPTPIEPSLMTWKKMRRKVENTCGSRDSVVSILT